MGLTEDAPKSDGSPAKERSPQPKTCQERVCYQKATGGITVSGIPEEAHEYMLGSRSEIDWIIERYQVQTDKASAIYDAPNDRIRPFRRSSGNGR